MANMLIEVQLAWETQLDYEEWSAEVTMASRLGPLGGVAFVQKRDIPTGMGQVGVTMRPTAFVTTEHATAIGLPHLADVCEEVLCHLIKPHPGDDDADGVLKHLTQVGRGTPVVRVMDPSLPDVELDYDTVHMVLDLGVRWPANPSVALLGDSIHQRASQAPLRLRIRRTNAAFYIFAAAEDALLPSSGQDEIFFRLGNDHPRFMRYTFFGSVSPAGTTQSSRWRRPFSLRTSMTVSD